MSPPFVTAVYMEKKDYLRRCQKNSCLMCMCLYAYVYQVLKNNFTSYVVEKVFLYAHS